MISRSSMGRAAPPCALRSARRRAPILVVAALFIATNTQDLLAAQVGASLPDTSTQSAIFGASDAALLAALLVTSVALVSIDAEVRQQVQGFRNGTTRTLAAGVEPFGRSALWFQASAATFVAGKVIGNQRVADVGLHAVLSLALANAVTWGLKGIGGRSRPYVIQAAGSNDDTEYHDPYAWELFGGWSESSRRSYPSNHATIAFTLAGVLSEEFGGAAPWVAYPVATAVAWSRVYHDAHWASDVTVGALVGIFSSRLVVRFGHGHGGPLERWLLVEVDPEEGTRVGLKLPVGS